MESPDWRAYIGDGDKQFVQAGGYISYKNKTVIAIVQYVMIKQDSYMIYALYVDRVLQNQASINQFLQAAYSK